MANAGQTFQRAGTWAREAGVGIGRGAEGGGGGGLLSKGTLKKFGPALLAWLIAGQATETYSGWQEQKLRREAASMQGELESPESLYHEAALRPRRRRAWHGRPYSLAYREACLGHRWRPGRG
jgi:hypothetical protein